MPIRPSVAENIRYLQRQINQQGTGRFGPMSIGPGDGRLRFYATDGRVLFEADSTGASVESRGSLTAMTPLLDSIRAKDDDQDDALGQHGSRLSSAEARIDTLHSRQNSADQVNAEQNGKLSQLRVDLETQTTRIDNRATNTRVDGIDSRVTSQAGRLGAAESSITSHGTRIGNAEGRLDNHVARIGNAEGRLDNHAGRIGAVEGVNSTQNSRLSQVEADNNTQDGRLDNHAIQLGNLRDGKASVGSVTTAQNRADAAYARAAQASAKADQIIAWINRNLLAGTGRTFPSDIPR